MNKPNREQHHCDESDLRIVNPGLDRQDNFTRNQSGNYQFLNRH